MLRSKCTRVGRDLGGEKGLGEKRGFQDAGDTPINYGISWPLCAAEKGKA
jgi:hypothetical protein